MPSSRCCRKTSHRQGTYVQRFNSQATDSRYFFFNHSALPSCRWYLPVMNSVISPEYAYDLPGHFVVGAPVVYIIELVGPKVLGALKLNSWPLRSSYRSVWPLFFHLHWVMLIPGGRQMPAWFAVFLPRKSIGRYKVGLVTFVGTYHVLASRPCFPLYIPLPFLRV